MDEVRAHIKKQGQGWQVAIKDKEGEVLTELGGVFGYRTKADALRDAQKELETYEKEPSA